MLEASNKMGPMDDAPNIDPMPPSNKKSPDPIPLTPLIILCRRLTANNKPYPKISPNTASRGIVNSSNPYLNLAHRLQESCLMVVIARVYLSPSVPGHIRLKPIEK